MPMSSMQEPPRPCHPVDGPFGPIEKRTKIFVPRKKRLEKLEKPHQLQASIIEEVRSRGQGLAKTSPAGVPGSEYGVGDVRKCMSSAPQEQQLVLDGISDMADDHLGGHDPTGVQWSAFASFE